MQQHVRSTRSRLAVAIAIGLGIAVTVFTFLVAVNNANAGDANRIPKTLVGNWYQEGPGFDGVIMNAEISPGSIQVNMTMRDTHGIYWMGSFNTYHHTSETFRVTSMVDPDGKKILDKSLFGSSETTKNFSYKNGVLTFKFTMLGMSADIHLTKHEPSYPAATHTVHVPNGYSPATPKYKSKTPPKVYVPKPAAPKPAAPKAVTPPKVNLKK